MPVARFQRPDGRVARFDVPDGTTPEQATTMMQSYFSPAQASTPAQPPEAVNTGLRGDGFNKATAYTGQDQIGGFLRGAGSIWATLARPFESAQANNARRANLDQSIAAFTGADPASTGYKTMKLGAEIAGTAGAGGAIAQGALEERLLRVCRGLHRQPLQQHRVLRNCWRPSSRGDLRLAAVHQARWPGKRLVLVSGQRAVQFPVALRLVWWTPNKRS